MPNTTSVKYPEDLYVTYNINGEQRQLIKESYYWDYDSSVNPNKTKINLTYSNFNTASNLNNYIFGDSMMPMIDLSGYSFNDFSGNIYDLSGHILDFSGNIIDPNHKTIDLSASVIFDISGDTIKSITNYSLSNNTYRQLLEYKLNQLTIYKFDPVVFLTYTSNYDSNLFNLGINTKNLAMQYYILYGNKTNNDNYSKLRVGENVIRLIQDVSETQQQANEKLMQFFLLNIADFCDRNNSWYALFTANGKTVISKTAIAYRYVTEPANTQRYLNFADISNKISVSVEKDPNKTTINSSFYLTLYPDIENYVKGLLTYGNYSDDHLTFDMSNINTICKAHYINSKHVRIGDSGIDENRYPNKDAFINATTGTKEEIILRAKYKEFNISNGNFNIKHYLSLYASELSGKFDPELHYIKYVYKLITNNTGYPESDVLPKESSRYSNLTEAFTKQNNKWKNYTTFPRKFYYALNKDIRDTRINDLINNNNNIIKNTDEDILDIIMAGHYVMNNFKEENNPYRNAVNKLINSDLETDIFDKYRTGSASYGLTEKFSASAYFFMIPDLYPWADDSLIDEIITVYNYVGNINKTIVINSDGSSKENRPKYDDKQTTFINAMNASDFRSAVSSRLVSRPDLDIKDPTNDKQITLRNYVVAEDLWNTGGFANNSYNNGAFQRVVLQHWLQNGNN